jgi:hypothetical protein
VTRNERVGPRLEETQKKMKIFVWIFFEVFNRSANATMR